MNMFLLQREKDLRLGSVYSSYYGAETTVGDVTEVNEMQTTAVVKSEGTFFRRPLLQSISPS